MKTIISILVVAWWIGLAVFMYEFYTSLGPFNLKDQIIWSNDSNLGIISAAKSQVPWSGIAMWDDLNHVGMRGPNTINFTVGLLVMFDHPGISLVSIIGLIALWFWSSRIAYGLLAITSLVASIMLLILAATDSIDVYTSQWMCIWPLALVSQIVLIFMLLVDINKAVVYPTQEQINHEFEYRKREAIRVSTL